MKYIYHKFGEGPKVSLFTLGTMRSLSSLEQMYSVVHAAYLAGINHLETAPSYGNAQNLLGKTLKELQCREIVPVKNWVITSKILPEIELEEGKKQILKSINELGVSKIHNLAIHGLNTPQHLNWALKGVGSEIITWALDNNFIGQVGFSSHGKSTLIKAAIESKSFKFCSLHLHLFDQERIPLITNVLNEGIGVMAISPADKGGHLHHPSKKLVKDCAPFSPIEIAYRFLLSKGVSTLTLGASKPEDLIIAKKLSRADHPLIEEEISVLNNLKEERSKILLEEECGQCRECLPCPNEVPIPELLRLRNLRIGHDLKSFTEERYNLIGRAGHWWEKNNASSCGRCGDCIPRCPNKLAIPDLLEDTHKRLIASPRRRLWS